LKLSYDKSFKEQETPDGSSIRKSESNKAGDKVSISKNLL
jgi:hypothetical protein